jgi:hypothetical protein
MSALELYRYELDRKDAIIKSLQQRIERLKVGKYAHTGHPEWSKQCDTICKTCGHRFGIHRSREDSCPNDVQMLGSKTVAKSFHSTNTFR